MFSQLEMRTAMQDRVPTQATFEGVPLQGITRKTDGSLSKPAEIHINKKTVLQLGVLAAVAASGAPADMPHTQVHLGPISVELDSFGVQTLPALATSAVGFFAGATRAFRLANSKRYEARMAQTNKEIKDALANQKMRIQDAQDKEQIVTVAEKAEMDIMQIAARANKQTAGSFTEESIAKATEDLINKRIHDDYMRHSQRCEKVNKWGFAFSEGTNAALDTAYAGVALSDTIGALFAGTMHWTRPILLTIYAGRGLYQMLGRNQQDILWGKTTVGDAFDLNKAA